MIIIERKMDLFKLDNSYTLVHCISEDCAMGKGIAKIFDRKFKDMKRDVFDTLVHNELHYPISIMFLGEKQNVINMITKKEYWHKPTYKTFEVALDDVVKICKKYNITKLGMPKIGCGLDRLQWEKVKAMIEDKFKDLNIEIMVCYL